MSENGRKPRSNDPSPLGSQDQRPPLIRFDRGCIDTVMAGDCVQILSRAAGPFVDLVFADPPFNIGYDYQDEYHDFLKSTHYLDWCRKWIRRCWEVLVPEGAFFLAIGDTYAAELKCIATNEVGLSLRNWIIWHYTFGQSTKQMFAKAHTHIFYFVKEPASCRFNADAVRVFSDRQKAYRDKRAVNTIGKIPDDVWSHFPRVCGTFSERLGHPCQMPEALLARIIRCCTSPGHVVLDPFAGSGTTLAVAKKLKRHYIGIDISENFVQAIHARLEGIDQRSKQAWKDFFWSPLAEETLLSLYAENEVPLEKLSESPYLAEVFTRQLALRLEDEAPFTPDQVLAKLQQFARTNTLPIVRYHANGKSIRTADEPRGRRSGQKKVPASP